MKKKNTNFNYLKIINYALLLLLVLHTLFYILYASRALLNSDSTFIVDYALEAIKYKTLFPKTWANTNDFWIYSLIPLIIGFLKA